MSNLLKDFRHHPQSVGETYAQHWCSAMSFAIAMIGSALACLVHAFVPGLFQQTASRTINTLHQRMVTHRHRETRSADPQQEPRTA